jgi:hypothetical protein
MNPVARRPFVMLGLGFHALCKFQFVGGTAPFNQQRNRIGVNG